MNFHDICVAFFLLQKAKTCPYEHSTTFTVNFYKFIMYRYSIFTSFGI